MKIENLETANNIAEKLKSAKYDLRVWESATGFSENRLRVRYKLNDETSRQGNDDVSTSALDFELLKQLTIVNLTKTIKDLEAEFARID